MTFMFVSNIMWDIFLYIAIYYYFTQDSRVEQLTKANFMYDTFICLLRRIKNSRTLNSPPIDCNKAGFLP